MAGTKEIKRRIKSVKNTKKITKAMELVAASKMKRAVSSTLSSRLYAEYSWEILTSIAKNAEELNHPLFTERSGSPSQESKADQRKILLILVTSNRGLCGAYNAQIIKKAISLLSQKTVFGETSRKLSFEVDVITIGRKGDVAMRRLNQNVLASFSELPDNISLVDVTPISNLVINEYSLGKYDRVLVVYTDFVSALFQRANIKQILPINKADLKELIDSLEHTKSAETLLPQTKTNYLFEGDKVKLITTLAEKLTRMQIYQMLLESNASEQSSRMVAMKNASEASGEMIDDLTLVFNKARQSNITREISEISAGMASVS
ncbi:ATP synthase F1 subunit gamma [Candidatus Nomurabacteria bacterium]|nr:ATP synthase F1 subunit gamma [Candidatus Nomurabacteria bacterium]